MTKKNQTFISNIILLSLLSQLYAEVDQSHNCSFCGSKDEIQVGVVLNMETWLGKVVHSCISMAVSDFYALNGHFKKRIVLHTRDSEGEPMHALSAAIDLIENIKVQTIIGPETPLESKFLAILGNKAKVPILSLTTNPSSSIQYPYFLQISQQETTQFQGIATLVESHRWRNVIVIYEDTDYEREVMSYIFDSMQEKNIHIAYKSAISPLAMDDQIIEELHKIIMTIQSKVFIIHMSPSLVSKIFSSASKLGMMREGYAWIITDRTMNMLHSMDSSTIETIQGALGFKSVIPSSNELQNFTRRWRRKVLMEDPNIEILDLNVFGLWAYDAIWGLARALEKANIRDSQSGQPTLLNELTQLRIKGLSGDFQLVNGKLVSKAFEIVNVVGKGDRRVGFWTLKDGITKELVYPQVNFENLPSKHGLEAIIWPGGSTTTPKGWLMGKSGKRLKIGVPMKGGFDELIKVTQDPITNATIATGFCINVFQAALELLPYEVPYDFVPFSFVQGQSSGSYSDLIYQVYLQKYEGVVGDTTITSNRSSHVDFTSPFTDLGVGMVAKVENKDMWIFLKPMETNLWLTSFCFFIITGFVVWVIEHTINEEFQGPPSQQLGTAFSFAFLTLVFAQREKLLSNLSRFILVIWVFVVFILTSSYTATLSSLLTVQQIQLAAKWNYIGYQGGSFVGGVIVNNLNFKNSTLQPYSSIEEYANALSHGSNNGGVVAIIDEIPYIKVLLASYPGDYSMIASETTTNGFGFAFQKGSPLAHDISQAIQKLREDGKLQMMENTWLKSRSSFMSQDISNNPKTLSLYNFSGLFFITGISIAIALFILLIHKLHIQVWSAQSFIFRSIGILEFMIKYLFKKKNNEIEQTVVR